MSPIWSRWNCRACGSEIGVDWRRRLVAVAVWIPTFIVLMGVVRVTRYGLWFAILSLVVIGFVIFAAFERIALITPRGFRCRGCGYDLRGQVAPHCPECGRALDEEERARLGAGFAEPPPVRTRRDRFVFYMVVLVPLTFLLAMGIAVQRRTAARATLPLPTSAPASAPSVSTAPMD
jgi:hypothetical protein